MELQLKNLILLQDVDSKIIKINSIAGDLPERIGLKENLINGLTLEVQNKNKKIEDFGKEARKLNVENEDAQIKLDKYKEQLFLVKSNKEYDALNHEIDHLKKILADSESQFITIESEKEELIESQKIDKKELETLQEKLQGEKEMLDKTFNKSKVELESLNLERDDITKNINNNYLSHYNKLKDATGLGLAPLNGSCCGNCFSTLPPQMIIEIKSNKIIHFCPSCSVIAFWEEEIEEN